MAQGFQEPDGSPSGLSTHLTALGGHASTLKDRSGDLRTGFAHALDTWHAPRSTDFRSAGEGLDVQTAGAHADLVSAVASLDTYRARLRQATDRIAELRHQADRVRERGARATEGLTADDPATIAQGKTTDAEVDRLREEADAEHRALALDAATARSAVDALVDRRVPQGSRLDPDQLRRRVTDAGVGTAGAALTRGNLTAAQAWTALTGAQEAAPPAGWQDWARAHGLTVPEPLDAARALELQSQLDQLLADAPADPGARADLVSRFTDSLSPADLTTLAALDPARVGNLDGVPNSVRYFANAINVSCALDEERQRLADWQPPPATSDTAYSDWSRLQGRIDTLSSLLSGGNIGQSKGPYQILAFEPPTYAGDQHPVDDGRLAVAVGDLDTAEHVGVVVPGITNRIDNFAGTLDMATNSATSAGPGSATVAWLGYDTPEFADSVTTDPAEEGGAALHDFLAGLRRSDDSDLTLIAHSYGTLVASQALQLGDADDPLVDRVVLFGSPGLGENVTSLADLHLPEGFPIYAMRAPGDPVSITAAHGTDPVDIPGITRLDTDFSGPEDVNGHSQYTLPDSDALFNIGRVLADDLDHVVEGGTPIEAGFAGDYNQNLRTLVDLLQAQVPAEVQQAFAAELEPEIQRMIESGDYLPNGPDSVLQLTAMVRRAAAESGFGDYLTQDEFEQAVIDAGFTRTLGEQAGQTVADTVGDLDFADGWSVPIPLTTARIELPGGLNEAAGSVLGTTTSFLTEHLSDAAVRNLPAVENVLGFIETTAGLVKGAQEAVKEVEDLARDAGDFVVDRVEDAGDFVQDRVEDAGDFVQDRVEDVEDFGEDAVDTVRDLVPGI